MCVCVCVCVGGGGIVCLMILTVHNVSTTYCWSSSTDGADYNLYSPDCSIVLLHVPLTVGGVLAIIAQKLSFQLIKYVTSY